ncbi:MAG TPA: ComF family protein [Bacillota bacterium]|nr:ComF family protein [Bacillota bacterium]
MKPAWTESFWRLIYPPRCLLCRSLLPPAFFEPLCSTCLVSFSPAGALCPRCEQPLFPASCHCSELPPLQGLYALSWYRGDWRRMLHRLKYEGRRSLARPLGTWLGLALKRETDWPLTAVTALPLHRLREARRGYNQSLLIARYTARAMGLPLVTLLKKTRSTPSQAGLSRLERIVNVAGVYAPSGRHFKPGPVLLIDDIYSTGATLKEAARVLNKQGFSVYAAVIAYNPRLF